MAFLTFGLCALVIIAAGIALAHYGDAISDHTKLGGAWIGAILVSGATSLPELTTDLAALRLGAHDLAAGDLLGSCMANVFLLALVDLFPPREYVLRRVTLDHVLLAALAIGLNALAAIFILAPSRVALWRIGPESLVLFVVYVVGMRVVYRQSTARAIEAAAEARPTLPTLRRSIVGFLAGAAAIVVTAPFFAESAKEIAHQTGLGTTFVGTLFVGLATSLPELVSSLFAVRIKAYDLAVGNLIGSCAFNVCIFFALDLATPGPFFPTLSPVHAMTAGFSVVLLALAIAAIVFRAERRTALIEPDSYLILVTYATALWFVYTRSTP